MSDHREPGGFQLSELMEFDINEITSSSEDEEFGDLQLTKANSYQHKKDKERRKLSARVSIGNPINDNDKVGEDDIELVEMLKPYHETREKMVRGFFDFKVEMLTGCLNKFGSRDEGLDSFNKDRGIPRVLGSASSYYSISHTLSM